MSAEKSDVPSQYEEEGRFLNRAGGAYEDAFDPNKSGSSVLTDGEGRASKKPTLDGAADDSTAAQNARESDVASTLASKAVGAIAATSPAGKIGGFINSVAGRGAGRSNGRRRGLVGRGLPILFAILGISGFGIATISAQMSLPVSLAENLMRRFDNMSVENRLVGRSFLKKQLNPKTRSIEGNGEAKNYLRAHSRIYASVTNKSQKYFKITEYQKKKLAKQHIELVDFDDGGTKAQYMKFTEYDADGKVKKVTNVVADSSQVDKIPGGAIDFDSAMTNDANSAFNTAYYNGAKTFRSAVGDWYKARTAAILKKFNVSRNRFSDFDATQDAEGQEKQLADTVKKSQADEGISATIEKDNPLEEESEAEDSQSDEKKLKQKGADGGYDTEKSNESLRLGAGAEGAKAAESTIREVISTKYNKVSGSADMITDFTCTAIDMAGAVNAVVTAYETLMAIRLASTILEGIQKTQVADSTESPINAILNALTDRTNTQSITVADVDATEAGNGLAIANNQDGGGAIATKEYKSTKSAMESAGVAMIYGARFGNLSKNASFASFNSNSFGRSLVKRVGGSMTTLKSCAYARAAAAVGNVVGSALTTIAACALPPGVGCLTKLGLDVAKKIGKALWKPALIAIVVSTLTPFVSNVMMRHVADSFAGEDLGNELVAGSKAYMSKVHHFQGGVYQTKESYTAYLNMKDSYEKEQSVYAQAYTSPFDSSSPYTFAGSLHNKLIAAHGQFADSGGGFGAISAIAGSFGSSLESLIPGAAAAGNGIDAEQAWEYTQENCPNQAEAGFIVDPASAICSVIVATTPHIVNSDPGQIIYDVSRHNDKNFFDSGEEERDLPKINEEGEYAEYLEACTFSDVEPGEADYNLKNEYESTTGHALADAAIGMIPIVGDAVSLFNSAEVIAKSPYISKEACAYNYDAPTFKQIPSKDELNDYAAVAPHSRVAVAQGLTDTDIIGEYAKDYYQKNPLDLSFEGILARYSGLTKDMVVATLDYLEVMNFIADYHPDGYGPLFYESQAADYHLEDQTPPAVAPASTISQTYFAEHRWRSYASS